LLILQKDALYIDEHLKIDILKLIKASNPLITIIHLFSSEKDLNELSQQEK
jgi:hypothetical protein